MPPIKLDHLHRLTDDCGIIQHAKYAIPNRYEGYCLDDNGRALLLIGMLVERGIGDREELQRLSDVYLAYIWHAQNEDGTFRNFMGYDRSFLERAGSEDSYGRALWGVGYCLAHPPRPDQRPLLQEIFIRAIGHLDEMKSPRTLGYGILSLTYYLDHHPTDESMLNLLDRLCNRLIDHYKDSSKEGWDWFEGYLTYCNGILPLAMFRALHHINKEAIRTVAINSTNFLASQTILDGIVSPVGCSGPYHHTKERPRYDQQPVDVMCMVLLFSEACRRQGLQPNCENLHLSFGWFTGNNDMKVTMYNAETGGCYDGLMATGTNHNQGAESLLAYLISRVEMENFCRDRPKGRCDEAQTEDTAIALKRLLNGFAMPDLKTTVVADTSGQATETTP